MHVCRKEMLFNSARKPLHNKIDLKNRFACTSTSICKQTNVFSTHIRNIATKWHKGKLESSQNDPNYKLIANLPM